MKQLIKIYNIIGTRSITSSSARLVTKSLNTDFVTQDASKLKEWYGAKPYNSIPGPKKLPLLGNTWRFLPFIGDLHGYDATTLNKLLHDRYGKIVKLGGLDFQETVYICDPDAIEHLFRNEGIYPLRILGSKSFTYYKKNVRGDVLRGFKSLTELQGPEWQTLRSKLNPILMHPQTILQYAEGMDVIAGQLIQRMRNVANTNVKKEMSDNFDRMLYAWTLESVMFVSLDKQLGCLKDDLPEDSEPSKLISATLDLFKLYFTIEKAPSYRNIYKTKTWKMFVENMDFLTFTFLKHIEEAIHRIKKQSKTSTEQTTILQKLLQVNKQFALMQALQLFMAGVDTTGTTAATCLYYLAKYPKVQSALREELCKLLPKKDSPITKEVLTNASYLRRVIKETTRLAPIAPFISRITFKDMVLCGYQIPKNTKVVTSNFVLSRSDEHYMHANEFIPERWLRTTSGKLSAKSANPFITLPFGYGPRSCIGKRLAMMELEIGVAKIIRNFYLEWHYKDATFKSTTFYGIVDPLKLRVLEVEQ